MRLASDVRTSIPQVLVDLYILQFAPIRRSRCMLYKLKGGCRFQGACESVLWSCDPLLTSYHGVDVITSPEEDVYRFTRTPILNDPSCKTVNKAQDFIQIKMFHISNRLLFDICTFTNAFQT